LRKAIIPFLVSLFFLASCGIFDSVYHATKEIEGACKVGVNYADFPKVLRNFSSEIQIARDKVNTNDEKDLLMLYEKVLDCYQDSLTLWDSIIGLTIGKSEVLKSIMPILTRYNIIVEYDAEHDIDIIPKASVEKIWLEASGKANIVNEVFLGKRKLRDVTKQPILTPPEIAYNRGNLYAKNEDFYHAISDYNEAIKGNPNFSEAYCNRGAAYLKRGNIGIAIFDYSEAIRINPNNAEAYYNRGWAYLKIASKSEVFKVIADYNELAYDDMKKAESLGYNVDPLYQAMKKQLGLPGTALIKNKEYCKDCLSLEGIFYEANGKSSAIINDKVVFEGDTVDGIIVDKINRGSVDIIINGEKKNIRIK
jgi:tetratricopeptide (TPR) repeat protein